MITVVLIGSGNVAQHLLLAFQKAKSLNLIQVLARHPKQIAHLLDEKKIISDYKELKEADLYVIAVSDNAIAEVSSQIPFTYKLVVHTSGSIPMIEIDSKNRKGVFYPLQTFSKSKEIDFSQIPIALEAETKNDLSLLEAVAQSISNQVYQINSEQRKALHVAAVFVCNFVNHLYEIGSEICKENNLSFDLLKPLILETADKILSLTPNEAQTGPAKREDTVTINAHLNFLNKDNQKEIYKLLTQSIIDNGKKL
ncbi:Rossmann-like and DUF2520 domain-containing protein [Flavobacterium capsici]|uniref:DUF2520 domain-containing protein n=1 Tax=Flavobacterium capsici TaxID=3075618 RepID=A0AA96J597_9FLAO|nr:MULTISPECIES: Rossmann-like and DUF2520 domain-containing protein [unclassified Flavobacterium]WNM18224.1 DUF2520 domain-containing protein [Flavobacterium sp. PMR2A8]WNM22275.1 DUF2520 domain-containing protein [Flavobacterium sp. PMTSA4]